jgi:hypothetical protein
VGIFFLTGLVTIIVPVFTDPVTTGTRKIPEPVDITKTSPLINIDVSIEEDMETLTTDAVCSWIEVEIEPTVFVTAVTDDPSLIVVLNPDCEVALVDMLEPSLIAVTSWAEATVLTADAEEPRVMDVVRDDVAVDTVDTDEAKAAEVPTNAEDAVTTDEAAAANLI